MLEPQNDEERKALRLLDAVRTSTAPTMIGQRFVEEKQRLGFIMALAEARAIVREEQAGEATIVAMDAREFELEHVRADITRTSQVVQALNTDIATYNPGMCPSEIPKEAKAQVEKLLRLLSRERELMAKSEPEG